ncbi:MAG: DUF1501 domain-containing protein [Fimbriiglobus sp.]
MLYYATTTSTMNRRAALQLTGCGFAALALSGFAAADAAKASPLAPKKPHFPAKAKRVIFLTMLGGPSHVDTFDYKPKLTADDGKAPPAGAGRGFGGGALLKSPWKFEKRGQAGIWMSELFPKLGEVADDLCMLHGMQTSVPAHPQAYLQMHTGTSQFVRPSLGAWTLYGLGTENENLPGFISINPPTQNGGAQNYGSAFLPAIYQGTRIGSEGRSVASAKVSNIKNTTLTPAEQRAQLDLIQGLNRQQGSESHIDGVIDSYELAFRMQRDVPKVMDLNAESKETLAMYGVGNRETDDFARQCLLARRFAEAGVRYIEIAHGNWDQHFNMKEQLPRHAKAVDQPIAALLKDLKRRGLLKDTLVVWSGEFGRTPYAQGTDGRDHNNKGFTSWMAGGGVKPGFVYGATDDYGFEAVKGKMPTHDFHATILHLLGLDHTELTYRYAGRDFRLTDVHGDVATDIVG